MPSAAAAVSVIEPPCARMVPVLVTSAGAVLPSGPTGTCRTWPLTSIASSPSPYRSTVAVGAPASTTVPIRALMTPWLATAGATSAASPLCLTVMVPLLTTIALGLPGTENLGLPAMKAALVVSAPDTTSELTSTWLPLSNTTPEPLTSTTLPLATMWPAISEGSPPVTRFSAAAWASGCWKSTVAAAPTLKLVQFTAAFWLVCRTVVTVAVWLMLACPATTAPPCGWAPGGSPACAGKASTSSAAACSAVLPSNDARLRRRAPTATAPPRPPAILRAVAIPPPPARCSGPCLSQSVSQSALSQSALSQSA